jgi:hypothetical protein
MIKKILYILFAILCIILLFIFLQKPSLHREWTDDAQILPDVTIKDNLVTVQNLRDWRYTKGATISREYYQETFDVNKISKAYFLLNPFGTWQGVGHAFFTFEFEDGKAVSISVEARRENNESFSAIHGLFNQFELWYTWGSPADLFARRAIYHDEDLYMYPLLIKPETVRGLFIDLAQTTEQLETNPKFYNTLTSNCTNVLADSANRVNKGSIPWTWARIFTGFSDEKLYQLKLIPHDVPFEEQFTRSRIDQKIKQIFKEKNIYSKEEFWQNMTQY